MKRLFSILFWPLRLLWRFLKGGLAVASYLVVLLMLVALIVGFFYKPEGDALVLQPKGDIVEECSVISPFTQQFNKLAGIPLEEEVFLQDLPDDIRAAGEDSLIKALVLDLARLGAASLDEVKAKGKRIIALGDRALAALDMGLVDAHKTRPEMRKVLRELVGAGDKGEFKSVSFDRFLKPSSLPTRPPMAKRRASASSSPGHDGAAHQLRRRQRLRLGADPAGDFAAATVRQEGGSLHGRGGRVRRLLAGRERRPHRGRHPPSSRA